MRVFVAVCAALVGLLASTSAAVAQDETRPGIAAEVIATDQPTAGLVEVAVTVQGVGAGETPVVHVAGSVVPSAITVEPLDNAPTVVLAIDVSGSMQGALLTAAQAAATRCVDALSPDTSVGLVAFADSVVVSLAPAFNRFPVNFALARLTAGGETATFDGVMEAIAISPVLPAETLDDRSSRFIILMGDGEDTVSIATSPEVVEALATSGFRVYALGLDPDGDNIATLEDLATSSGGVVLNGTAAELGDLCASVVERIDSRYRVSLQFDEAPPTPLLLSLEFDELIARAAVDVPEPARPNPTATPTPTVTAEPTPSAVAEPTPATTPEPGGDVDGTIEAPPGDASAEPPASPPADGAPGGLSVARLWGGAAAVAATPMLAAFALAPKRRIRHGLRVRGMPRASIVARLSVTADRLLKRNRLNQAIDKKLELAALSVRAGEFVVFTAFAAVGPAFFFGVLGMKLTGLAALVGVPSGAWLWISRRSRRRKAHFQEQLGDTLIVLAGSLRSGSSTMQALSAVAAKAQSPSAEEFKRVVSEARIGRDVIDSLHDLADRMGSDDVRWMVEAIALNRELGGNLASTLDNVAETMQIRAQIKSQVQVLSAEGRLTAIILLGLPFAIALFLQWQNPGYLGPLFSTPTGNIILAIALGLMTVGAFWVSRLIKLEY